MSVETKEPIASRLFDATVCIDGIWPIPQPSPPDALIQAFDCRDDIPEGLRQFTLGWDESDIGELLDGDGRQGRDAWEGLFENMFNSGRQGVIVACSTPVFTAMGSGGGGSYSWGHTHVDQLYAESFEAAVDAVIAWAEKCQARDLKR